MERPRPRHSHTLRQTGIPMLPRRNSRGAPDFNCITLNTTISAAQGIQETRLPLSSPDTCIQVQDVLDLSKYPIRRLMHAKCGRDVLCYECDGYCVWYCMQPIQNLNFWKGEYSAYTVVLWYNVQITAPPCGRGGLPLYEGDRPSLTSRRLWHASSACRPGSRKQGFGVGKNFYLRHGRRIFFFSLTNLWAWHHNLYSVA